MVAWQMETGHKQFIPRLLSTIRSIVVSADNLHYALMHADNAVRIVSAVSSRVSRSIQGMEIGERRRKREGEERVQPVLVAAESAGGVLMGGRSGYVQVWDVWTDVHVCDVDVTERNYVSRMDETLLHLYRVEHVALTSEWMLTVERRTDAEMRHKQALKFFRHSSQAAAATATTAAPGSPYILNTRIDQPHKQSITSTAFHPTLPIAVTAAADRTFKVWQMAVSSGPTTTDKSDKSDKAYWFCAAEGFYRDFPIHAASFSRDGLLAVSYGQLITVWALKYDGGLVDGLELRRVLVHGSPLLPVLHMCWLGEGGRIATASADSVSVWDVRTGLCEWSWRLKVTSMCCDERGLMALCVNSTRPTEEEQELAEEGIEKEDENKEEKGGCRRMRKRRRSNLTTSKPANKRQARRPVRQSTQPPPPLPSSLVHSLPCMAPRRPASASLSTVHVAVHIHRLLCTCPIAATTHVIITAVPQQTEAARTAGRRRERQVRAAGRGCCGHITAQHVAVVGLQSQRRSRYSSGCTGKAALQPPTATVEPQPIAVEVVGDGGKGRRFAALFGTASHTLPAMSTLFAPFIHSVLHQQPPQQERTDEKKAAANGCR